jgi:hypothetical protein
MQRLFLPLTGKYQIKGLGSNLFKRNYNRRTFTKFIITRGSSTSHRDEHSEEPIYLLITIQTI